MKYVLLIAMVFGLGGCAAASLVQRSYGKNKGGVVKYLNQGADFVINQRRSDAESKMSEFCGGLNPVVLSEDDLDHNVGSATSFSRNTAYSANVSESYTYINFRCE